MLTFIKRSVVARPRERRRPHGVARCFGDGRGASRELRFGQPWIACSSARSGSWRTTPSWSWPLAPRVPTHTCPPWNITVQGGVRRRDGHGKPDGRPTKGGAAFADSGGIAFSQQSAPPCSSASAPDADRSSRCRNTTSSTRGSRRLATVFAARARMPRCEPGRHTPNDRKTYRPTMRSGGWGAETSVGDTAFRTGLACMKCKVTKPALGFRPARRSAAGVCRQLAPRP